VFLFHRDLRTVDNTALDLAKSETDRLYLVFIFDPRQIEPRRNPYFSHAAVQFMCESLAEIPRLNIFFGEPASVLDGLFRKLPHVSRLYENRDMSVFAAARANEIQRVCSEHDVSYVSANDYALFDDGGRQPPYKVFAPFYKYCLDRLQHDVRCPLPPSHDNFMAIPGQRLSKARLRGLYRENKHPAERGGRSYGELLLRRIPSFAEYGTARDWLHLDTTRASAHLKFGTISIREMLWHCIAAFKGDIRHPLIRQLLFREFYMHMYANPDLQRGAVLHPKRDRGWKHNARLFRAWKTGHTGFPVVDAGIRQLLASGWMHNRARMIVANFLCKLCRIDWRRGAQFFYTKLIDCDVFSNTAGWHWAASVGADAQSQFRLFNPFRQSQRFDADATYIKRWVPELRHVPAHVIHRWHDPAVRIQYAGSGYSAPLIDYFAVRETMKGDTSISY
jgi:deoxyribodipyrimidine photo-lyase